ALCALAWSLAGCAGKPTAPQQPAPSANLDQSVSPGRPVVASERERARIHTELGVAHLGAGQFEIALDQARIALEALDSHAPAYNLRGLVHMALGQNDQAEAAFRQAVRLDPASPEIANNFGWFLCQTGRVKESFPHFDRVLRNPLYRTPARVLHNMGVCALMDKDDNAGESYLLRALRIDPVNPRAHYLLAELDYRRGRLGDARDRLGKLHAMIDPTAETVWLSLRIDRKLGDRRSEAANTGILRSRFRDSPEYLMMMRGEFD
ncbi:MAG: type IV pilus biogenesis/stability protein PilW, partial [Sulfuritalea sp.]|nr:type IV pilus biogenesis/stability protein PilW [Sulfuritalea sp.]